VLGLCNHPAALLTAAAVSAFPPTRHLSLLLPSPLQPRHSLERGEAFHRCRWSFELTPTGGQPELNLFLSR
jgi:hypothetical protein